MKQSRKYRQGFAVRPLPFWIGALGVAFAASTAQAQIVHNITIGNPKALALGNAVTADPPGIDSIHFNPAGLAKIKGRERNFKFLVASMTLEGEFGKQHADELEKSYNAAYCPGGEASCLFQPDTLENTSSSTSDPMLILPGTGVKSVPVLAVPFGGIAVEDPDYGWTFATAFYSPQAIGYERDENDPAAFQGYNVATARLTYFSPSVGLQINDELSVGASVGFSWQGFGVHTKFRAPEFTLAFLQGTASGLNIACKDGAPAGDCNANGKPDDDELILHLIGPYENVGNLELEMEDPLSLSFNLGLLYEPYEWISFGVVYQSESSSDLEGDYKMSNSAAFQETIHGLVDTGLDILTLALTQAQLNNMPVEKGDVSLEYKIPQALAIGTSVKVFPNLKINADVKWIDYSVWDSLDIKFDKAVDFLTVASAIETLAGENDSDPNQLKMPRGYEDAISFAIGAEYQYDDATVLRFGYEPRTSVVPDDKIDFLVPISDANLYSFGIGYRLDKFSRVDAAFAYMVSEFDLVAGESNNSNGNKAGDVVYNPYAYLDISGKTTAFLFAFSYDQRF